MPIERSAIWQAEEKANLSFKVQLTCPQDLGLRDAGEKQRRVRLAVAIDPIIETRHRSQTAAARRLCINQPKSSGLVKYRSDGIPGRAADAFLVYARP
jgi:predicted XRE-type DNA-binding protein